MSDSQFEARALMKAFTVTASWAKKLYGVSLKKCPLSVNFSYLSTNFTGKRNVI